MADNAGSFGIICRVLLCDNRDAIVQESVDIMKDRLDAVLIETRRTSTRLNFLYAVNALVIAFLLATCCVDLGLSSIFL